MSKSKKRKGNPFRTVLILTVLFAILAVGCYVAMQRTDEMAQAELTALQDEVKARNQVAEQQYASELAEFQYQQQKSGGANHSWPSPVGQGWEALDLTNYPLEVPMTQQVDRQSAMYNGMLLVNEWHSRPSDFSEETLESASRRSNGTIRVSSNTLKLFPDAIDAWTELLTAAKVQKGFETFMLNEGYRSYADQEKMFNARKDKLKNNYTDEDALIEATKKYVNYPGTSEFNTGLTATIRLYKSGDSSVNEKDSNFFTSEEGIWLVENAYKYGFVFRFPKADYPVAGTQDKSYKTGVSATLRAFRYVGPGNAAAMKALDMCMEEYIEYLAEHPHIAIFSDGELKYEISRQYVGEDENFSVSVTGKAGVKDTSVSLDNMGYAIVVFAY